MGKRIYNGLAKLIRACTRPNRTEWEVPFEEGPCVFVVNHAGLFGPLDMCAKFPLRDKCHPWMNHGMMDRKEVPAYVRQDYWWKPGCFFEPLLNVTVPYIAAAVVPPVLNGAPGVPVYHDQRVMITMKESVRLLKEGEYLIIFPEQPSGWKSHHTWINTGWLRLGELWYRTSGQALKLYPVHLDHRKHLFSVSAPVYYDPSRKFAEQEKELADALAAGLRGENTET